MSGLQGLGQAAPATAGAVQAKPTLAGELRALRDEVLQLREYMRVLALNTQGFPIDAPAPTDEKEEATGPVGAVGCIRQQVKHVFADYKSIAVELGFD